MRWPRYNSLVALIAMLGFCLPAEALDPADHYYNLEYDEAIDQLRVLVRESPQEPRFPNELAGALLYREVYRSGEMDSELVTGDTELVRRPRLEPPPGVVEEIESSIRTAMALVEKRLADDPDDVDALYELGVSNEARAAVNFFIHKAWLQGLRDAAKSRRLHDRVVELDPELVDAALTQGAHDYLISQLPLAYKVVGSLVGFRGNRKRGIETIERVAREGDRRRVSAQLLLSALYRRENQPELAVPLLKELTERYPRNHLFPVELVQMQAASGDLDAAFVTLAELAERVEAGAPGFAQLTKHRVTYLGGHVQFRLGLFSEAEVTLLPLVADAAGVEPETRALAWLRIGQIRDLRQERGPALDAYRESSIADPLSDAARQARQFLVSPYREQRKEPKGETAETAAVRER